MRQLPIIIAAAVLLLIAGGLLLLGAFPPHPTPQPVQHTLPNDRFQAH